MKFDNFDFSFSFFINVINDKILLVLETFYDGYIINCGHYNPHTQKSSGVKSGDLAGHTYGPHRPSQRCGNASSRNCRTIIE